MTKKRKIIPLDIVANNPRYDRQHNMGNGMDADAYRFALRNTLYDNASSSKSAKPTSGNKLIFDKIKEFRRKQNIEKLQKTKDHWRGLQ